MGQSLVSPQLQADGTRHPSYELMKELQPGDVVFHINTAPDRTLEGVSLVAAS